jgi:hypothetical protein
VEAIFILRSQLLPKVIPRTVQGATDREAPIGRSIPELQRVRYPHTHYRGGIPGVPNASIDIQSTLWVYRLEASFPMRLRFSEKGIITMAKKKSAKASADTQRRKRAEAKAHVKSLQKAHQKLKLAHQNLSLELKKVEKGLADPMLIWHRD